MNNQSQPAGEKETKMTEIKIDKSTLPKDGSRVRFKTDKGDVFEGYFTGGDNIFQVGYEDSAKDWFFSWYVSEWEYIDGEPVPSTPNQSDELQEARKEIEKWKDEYGAMDEIIQEKTEQIRKLQNALEGAKELLFPYWKKEHPGIPSARLIYEWELYLSESNLLSHQI